MYDLHHKTETCVTAYSTHQQKSKFILFGREKLINVLTLTFQTNLWWIQNDNIGHFW